MFFVEDFNHLLERRDGTVDNVVGQQHGEWLIADHFARHKHGMAQTERFLLADVAHVDHVGDLADDLEQIVLPALLEHLFQFIADVEVVFDGLLAAASDNQDLVAARCHGFFDPVLNDGLVDQRQHLFGLSFGGGEEAGAEAGGGEHGFADFHGHGPLGRLWFVVGRWSLAGALPGVASL